MHYLFSKTFFLAFFLIIFPASVFADTLFIAPASGSYAVGDTITVRIGVSSALQSVNALSGVVSFPTDKLQATSVSKSGSIVSLWVKEPSFSNSRGTASFEGVVPNPGFTGSNGRIVTVNFKVVGSGSASIGFASGSVLANDGQGTNILKSLESATFGLSNAPTKPDSKKVSPEFPEPSEEPEPKTISITIPSFESIWNIFPWFLSAAILVFFLIRDRRRRRVKSGVTKRDVKKRL